MGATTDGLKVRLKSTADDTTVVFNVTPDVTENRQVNYRPVEPLHAPGGIYVYNTTASRTFSIANIKLIARTREEASANLTTLNLLRGWTQSYFGKGTYAEEGGAGRLGAPPDVLKLRAYGKRNIYDVPVVMTTLGITYPSDITYIPSMDNEPFPAIMTLDMTLSETHSPNEYLNFSLDQYKRGELPGF